MVGGDPEIAPIKSYLRVCEKLVLDYEGDVTKVVDLVRGKVLCESVEQMSQTIVAFASLDPGLAAIYDCLPPLRDKRQTQHKQSTVIVPAIMPGSAATSPRLEENSTLLRSPHLVDELSQESSPYSGSGRGISKSLGLESPRAIDISPRVEGKQMPVSQIQLVCVKNRLGMKICSCWSEALMIGRMCILFVCCKGYLNFSNDLFYRFRFMPPSHIFTDKLGDCLMNFTMLQDDTRHVCEVQVSLKKVEVARGSALGGHDSYKYVS